MVACDISNLEADAFVSTRSSSHRRSLASKTHVTWRTAFCSQSFLCLSCSFIASDLHHAKIVSFLIAHCTIVPLYPASLICQPCQRNTSSLRLPPSNWRTFAGVSSRRRCCRRPRRVGRPQPLPRPPPCPQVSTPPLTPLLAEEEGGPATAAAASATAWATGDPTRSRDPTLPDILRGAVPGGAFPPTAWRWSGASRATASALTVRR